MNLLHYSSSPEDHLWNTSSPDLPTFTRHAAPDQHQLDTLEDPCAQDYVSDSSVFESYVEQIHASQTSSLWGRIVFLAISSVCVVAILSMALFHIWAQGQATRLGFVYSQTSKKYTRLKEESWSLKLRLAKLRDPKRLSRIARQQLGMRLPSRSQVISEDKVIEQLQRRAAAPRPCTSKQRIRLASFDNQLRIQ